MSGKSKKISKKHLSLSIKDSIAGYFFLLPWLLGLVFFFIRPFLQVVWYSINKVSFTDSGKLVYDFAGFSHYKRLFFEDSEFLPVFFNSLTQIISNVVFITFFSVFVALLLNKKFKGRSLVRAIFFLPVIIASGVVVEIINNESIARLLMSGNRTSTLFQAGSLSDLFVQMNIPQNIIDTFNSFITNIFNLSWKSGIQILLFLAGLQTVPPHLYEAADVEGCTKWEKFWLITFPMITPVLLLNVIFTVIDAFNDYNNKLIRMIVNLTQRLTLDYGAAMGLVYFTAVLIIIGWVYLFINKKVHYN